MVDIREKRTESGLSTILFPERRGRILGKRQTLSKMSLWKQIKMHKVSYGLLAPYFILFTIFTVLPVLASLILGFTYFNMLEFPRWVGLSNYETLFLNDDVFLIAVKNTLVFAFLTGPLSYLACFIFAWLINELPRTLRTIMTLVFYAPSLAGNVYTIWRFIFSGDQYGLVNGFLMRLNIIKEPVQWLTDPETVMQVLIIVQLWLSLGAGFLAFIAGFKSIDPTMYEAGAIDGIKNRWEELWYLTIPSMKPQMLFGAVMQIATSFAVGNISIELAGFPSTNYSAHTIMTHIYDYGTVRYDMGYACAISTVLLVVMLLTNRVIRALLLEKE